MSEYERYRETLAKIAELVNAAVNEDGYAVNGGSDRNGTSGRDESERRSACILRQLPEHLQADAAKRVKTRIERYIFPDCCKR